MKISDLGEFGLIDRIRRLSHEKNGSVPVGIGDDAAAVKISPLSSLLVTTDLLIEDVHFDLSLTDFFSLGWKSAAVNLSDIAAMGGIPRFCLTGLGIPRVISVEQIADFYRGFNALLRRYATVLVGGDTCSSGKGLFIGVTALGEAKARQVVTRKGAKPGDRIFVTGTLGDAAAGLEILRTEDRRQKAKDGRGKLKSALRTPHSALVKRHLRPVPRIAEGRKLAVSGCAGAMIDISDGLSSDLSHVCGESGVGADIFAEQIPVSGSLERSSDSLRKPVLEYALSGGEDYELLFTVPPTKIKKLRSLNIAASEIGLIRPGKGISLIDSRGRKKRLIAKGYQHFVSR